MTSDLKVSTQTNHCTNTGRGTPGSNLSEPWREDGRRDTELHIDDEKGRQRSQVVAFHKRDGSLDKTVAQQRQGTLFVSSEIASLGALKSQGFLEALLHSSSSSSLMSAILNQTY